jgi:hypothetical protein
MWHDRHGHEQQSNRPKDLPRNFGAKPDLTDLQLQPRGTVDDRRGADDTGTREDPERWMMNDRCLSQSQREEGITSWDPNVPSCCQQHSRPPSRCPEHAAATTKADITTNLRHWVRKVLTGLWSPSRSSKRERHMPLCIVHTLAFVGAEVGILCILCFLAAATVCNTDRGDEWVVVCSVWSFLHCSKWSLTRRHAWRSG